MKSPRWWIEDDKLIVVSQDRNLVTHCQITAHPLGRADLARLIRASRYAHRLHRKYLTK